MSASCVACSAFTARPIDTRSGLMCPSCARFMSAAIEDLEATPAVGMALDLDAFQDAAYADLLAAALAA